MTHLQVDPPAYLKTPPLGGTLPPDFSGPVSLTLDNTFRD